MKPTIGRVVIYTMADVDDPCSRNGATELPAVIVRVWTDTCVNLKVFTDDPHDQWRTSVTYSETPSGYTWRWPARV
jgi:hypothetical protein